MATPAPAEPAPRGPALLSAGPPLKPLFGADRHELFAAPAPDLGAFLASRTADVTPPELRVGSRCKSTQAIVVLCSGADGGGNEGCGSPPSPASTVRGAGWQWARLEQPAGERWCSWADTRPLQREKLVEEELARTHKEYLRLFQQHGGVQRVAGGDAAKAAPAPCRACYDPAQEHLLTVVGATRRLTKERIVFHYMHHNAPSVPALREEGKLLLYFQDSNEFQRLDLSVVHEHLQSPAVYVFDCPYAGRLVQSLDSMLPEGEEVVALGTCGGQETLPWSRLGLPADLFTACLMSPVRAALSLYRVRNAAGVMADVCSNALRFVTGRPQDRCTPLGDLMSVYTAITDAIAWTCLPPRVFQRLFREDGALAELCRNFLLAARILDMFGLSATSRPALPPTHWHHLWDVWDSLLEVYLLRLMQQATPHVPRAVGASPQAAQLGHPCSFFDEQMAAFSVWLRFQQPLGASGQPPEAPAELPVLLQCLLHPGCRLQALQLLALFVDLGIWAVHLVVLVGARPYLTKLLSHDDLQASLEVPGLALVVWTKILAVDAGREGLPGKDAYKAFFKLLRSERLSGYHRALAGFCLAVACRSKPLVRQGLMQAGLLDVVADVLSATRQTPLRWATCLLFAEACRGCGEAAADVVRGRACTALLAACGDGAPEVRAGAVCALGHVLRAAPRDGPGDVGGASAAAPGPLAPECSGAGAAQPGAGAAAGAAGCGAGGGLASRAPSAVGGSVDGSAVGSVGGGPIGGASARRGSSATGAGATALRDDCPWRWLAQSTRQLFGSGAAEVDEPSFGYGGLATAADDCSLLNDSSTLVRYELVCALAPRMSDLAADPPSPPASSGSALAGAEAPPSPEGADGRGAAEPAPPFASAQTLSALAAASHRPAFPRPNSSLFAMPVAAAHQPERRFVQLLLQDPLLASLDAVRRLVPAGGLGGRLASAAAGAPPRGRGGRGGAGLGGGSAREPGQEQLARMSSQSMLGATSVAVRPPPGRPGAGASFRALRRVVSESAVSGLLHRRQGVPLGVEDENEPLPQYPESVFFAWTLNFLQQPNALASLRDMGTVDGGGAANVGAPVDLVRANVPVPRGDCGDPGELGDLTGLPRCPYGVPPLDMGVALGSDPCGDLASAECACCGCRAVTLPMQPCPLTWCPEDTAPHRWTTASPTPPCRAPGALGEGSGDGGGADDFAEAREGERASARAEGHADEGPSPLGGRGSQVVSIGPSQVLNMELFSDFQDDDHFPPCEFAEPFASGALCLSPSRDMCWVRGRPGRVDAVNIRRASVTRFGVQAAARPEGAARAALSRAAASPSADRCGAREERPVLTQLCALEATSGAAPGADRQRALLCCATDDGAVHVCRSCYCGDHEPAVLCVFQALPRRQNAALRVHWMNQRSHLVAGGRDPVVRIWDLAQERLAASFRHHSMHCVSCLEAASAGPHGSGPGGLVLVGRGDGSLLAADPRTRTGEVLSHKGALESVATIVPSLGAGVGSGEHLVAAADDFGVVDIWDLRRRRTFACYQLGVGTAADWAAGRHTKFQRSPALCHAAFAVGGGCAGASGAAASGCGLVAAIRLLPESPRVLSVADIATGVQRCAVTLPEGFRPTALSFHPHRGMCGIVARAGRGSRLLLYSGVDRDPD